MNRALILGLLVLSVCAGVGHADRGMITFKPNVQVFEPTQRAMIAWNGEEELLVLSTDLRASQATKVLEVLPLPAEPKVTKGDVEVFRKATALINRKMQERAKSRGRNVFGEAAEAPAGEITFHEKIGTHDVSVARVISRDGFLDWVNGYLKKAGVDNPVVPQSIGTSVEEYLKEGFAWFVFDVVSLDEVPKTNEAVQYRFKTGSLFYPAKISRTNSGETSIELLVLTPKLLRAFPGIPIARVELRHPPVSITAEELRSLNEDMDALLGHRGDMQLRIWRIRGEFSSFDKDLVAR